MDQLRIKKNIEGPRKKITILETKSRKFILIEVHRVIYCNLLLQLYKMSSLGPSGNFWKKH